jgi:oxalate decarboxylase
VGVDRLVVSSGTGYSTEKEEPMIDDALRFGDPRLPAETITSHSHLFPLGAQAPTTLDGGSYQQANEDNFPILKGQEASSCCSRCSREVSASRIGIQRVGDEHRH